MCDQESTNVGDLVPDETRIYRACPRTGCFNDNKTEILEAAFYKERRRDPDGFSGGLTPEAATRRLNSWHGIISITVAEIRSVRGLEVRYDTDDENHEHVLVRRMPCADQPLERGEAEAVASELRPLARIESTQKIRRPR